MDVKYLNPFVEAATEVLSTEIKSPVFRGELRLEKSSLTTDDVTVLICLVGQIYGVVMLGMSTATGLGITSEILGQDFEKFDSLAQSGVAELGNVITGCATIKLSKTGIQSNISPPTLITGKKVQVSTLDFQRIVVPLQTRHGDLIVHLALKEKMTAAPVQADEVGNITLPLVVDI